MKLFVKMHPIFLVVESLVVEAVELLLGNWSVGSILRLREVEVVVLAKLLPILYHLWVACCVAVLLHMCCQSGGPQKFLVAVPTNIWSLRLMLLLVILKKIKSGKATFAICEITLKRLLSVVNSQMREQISFFPESLFTSFFGTNKWSLPSMKAHVDLQTTGS